MMMVVKCFLNFLGTAGSGAILLIICNRGLD